MVNFDAVLHKIINYTGHHTQRVVIVSIGYWMSGNVVFLSL